MSLARTLCCSVWGSFGILFCAGTALGDAKLGDANIKVSLLETTDECTEVCIDRYLWSLYERTPKIDTVKVSEKRKVKIKRKGRTRTVTRTFTKFVTEDFTWKDPKAAQKAGMSVMDYVIGGMDRNFKLTLYHALRASDDAGFAPGITSGFRDDYRQAIATGNKARSDSSYHGGSRRGGYGHGLAVDLVSVNGETRSARWVSSERLWKWIDTNGKDFGVGRPYLDRDAPHVAPIQGREYAAHRGGTSAQHAVSKARKRHRIALHEDHRVPKHGRTARVSKVRNG